MTATDELAAALFTLDAGALTTSAVTKRITRVVIAWAESRGWATRSEARVGVGEVPQRGFVDIMVHRQPAAPDIAIEIDSTDKAWSLDKLRHAAAAGMHAIWIRWGDDAWAGVFEDVDVIQLPLTRRPAARLRNPGQLSLWGT